METSLDVKFSFSQISYSSTSPELSSKKNYPHFYRTIPDDASFNAPRIALLRAFKWSHVGTIFQEEDIHRTVQGLPVISIYLSILSMHISIKVLHFSFKPFFFQASASTFTIARCRLMLVCSICFLGHVRPSCSVPEERNQTNFIWEFQGESACSNGEFKGNSYFLWSHTNILYIYLKHQYTSCLRIHR